jgi:hypothetical protein
MKICIMAQSKSGCGHSIGRDRRAVRKPLLADGSCAPLIVTEISGATTDFVLTIRGRKQDCCGTATLRLPHDKL